MKKISQPIFQTQLTHSLVSDLYRETFSIHDGLLQIRLVDMQPQSGLPAISAWTERVGLIIEGEVTFKAERQSLASKVGSEAVLAGSEPVADEGEAERNDSEIKRLIDTRLLAGQGFYLPPNLKDQEFSIEPEMTCKILLLEHAFAGIDDHHIPDHFSILQASNNTDASDEAEGATQAKGTNTLDEYFKCLHEGQLDNLHVYGLTLKPGQRVEMNSHTGKLMLLPVSGHVLAADDTSPAIELGALSPAWKSDSNPMLLYAGDQGAHLCVVGLGDLCEISIDAF